MKKGYIKFDGQSLFINDERKILIGGEFHYFRTPEKLWEDRLKKIKQAGCNLITTYIPWNFHEKEEGKLFWEGDRDLPRFLEMCQKYGLYIIIKPGPYICAEWDFGGFPHWLLEKDITLRMPDKKYLDIVDIWYKQVAKIIKPYLITNGGNIVLIQIENEYDHLIEEGELPVSKAQAKDYLLSLLKSVRNAGIDIPAFTNEGSCILGTEIINTHTYYPNIPWIWMWEFNDFDRKIEQSRREQPDKPLMILELEAGWFAQFGKPLYDVETELTDAIVKTVLAYGASVINYYMAVGGTSFPYWPAKGDFGGIGICTTFDFGISPVREWGEIHEKYHHLRNYAYLLQSFPEIITQGKTIREGVGFNKGAETIIRLNNKSVNQDPSYQGTYENIKLLYRQHERYSMIMVRNLEPEERSVKLKFSSKLTGQEIIFPSEDLDLPARSSLFLPVDFHVSELNILYSTSEIILSKQLGQTDYLFFKGLGTIKGEMVLGSAEVEILEGPVKQDKYSDQYIRLSYSHDNRNVIRINNIIVVILSEQEANKLWQDDDFILISDFYHFRDRQKKKDRLDCSFQIKSDHSPQTLRLWSTQAVQEVEIQHSSAPLTRNKDNSISLEYTFKEPSPNNIRWSSDWKFKSDVEEKEKNFKDKQWVILQADVPLEKSKLFDHGYYWYRYEFEVNKEYEQVKIKLESNNMDRFTVYLNGRFRWIGIGSPELDISSMIAQGKNVLAICYENAYHTKAHPHEGPVKKLSGMYCPVTVSFSSKGKTVKQSVKEWKVRNQLGGVNKKYFTEDFNDRDWQTFPQAEKYIFEEEVGNIIWLRRCFNIRKADNWDAPLYINIKECHERCLLYVNGYLMGKYENIGPQHRFYVPENFLKEKNVLILVIEGPGFHPVKQFGFLPPKLVEPEIGFFYEAKDVPVVIKY